MVEETKIDTNLYSRQIGTFGLETMGKLVKMNVLIIGMRGLGVEVAKNLCLAGPKSVTLYDPNVVSIADRGSNFYLKEEHVGTTTRADASVTQLRELNPYVVTQVISEFNNEMIGNFNVIVITENFMGISALNVINNLCRAANVGFILAETMGLSGYTFLDYGSNFIVTDKDGEMTKSFIISSIEQTENPVVYVHEDKRHSFQDGDFVKFVEVEGMTELNGHPPIQIYDTRAHSFRLKLNTSSFGAYTRQGIVEDVKVPTPVSFHSLEQSARNPAASTVEGYLQPLDMNYFGMGRSEQLHIAFAAVHLFHAAENRYPHNNADDLAKVVTFANAVNAQGKEQNGLNVENVDEDIVKKVAAYSTCSIVSMTAFFGGLIAQEVVKYTGKYMPLKQWVHYDCFESLPTEGTINREPMNCRYDDQIKIYGRDVQEKLGNIKTFMIGAGALGCEYVKAMSLMGLSCGPNGALTVTDNDNIEISNLNRQFLFRKVNVGHSKSATACGIAKEMNPDLKVRSLQEFVGKDTESIFNDEFWDSLDYVVNAVDNIKARLYVDQQCVWYGKPLLESGTLGTKANAQMIVPHKTQCYGDSQDPPEESIPMCTLRNFPNQIEHCIEWGRDQFNTLFTTRVQDAVEFLRNPEAFVKSLRQNTTSSGVRAQLADIHQLIELKKTGDITRCIQEARDIFDKNYDHSIRDLKALFPDDHMTSGGQPFWSGPKRSPHPLTFSADDELSVEFVYNCANLIFANLGMPSIDRATAKNIAGNLAAKPYVQKVIVVETPEEVKEREAAGRPAPTAPVEGDDDEPVIVQLLDSLRVSTSSLPGDSLVPADFEKDNDENFHIDFINACSNLRARNYKIHECDRNKTKMIAGKIIPAIATTTAMITGVVCNEIFKFSQGFNDVTKFKNAFVNLALPLFLFSQPDDIKKNVSKEFDPIMCGPVTMLPEGFTNYDKVVINQGSMTFQQLFDWLKANHGVDITMVTCGEVALYNGYLPQNRHAPRLTRAIEDVYREITSEAIPAGRRYLRIDVGGSIIESGADFQMPPIKYYFA